MIYAYEASKVKMDIGTGTPGILTTENKKIIIE